MTELDGDAIRRALSADSSSRFHTFEVFSEIGSTNSHLVAQAPPTAGQFSAAIADHQTAGRGRRNNTWVSAPGDSLCLSLGYTFLETPQGVSSLSLALGVAAARALVDQGVGNIRLKWPNDVLVGDAKLGGILAESQFRRSEELSVVAGIGINMRVPAGVEGALDSSWATAATSIDNVVKTPPQREELAAAIMDEWVSAFSTFEQGGFESFEDDYRDMDWLLGKTLVVDTPDGQVRGLAAGIDRSGALLVDGKGGQCSVLAGTVKTANGSGVA